MESCIRQHDDTRRTARLYIGLQQAPQFNATILALSAASFLYIGLADLVPGLHQRIGAETGLGQLFLILAGIGTILLLHMHYN